MPMWFALCNGGGIAHCRDCRRLATRYPGAAAHRHQPYVQPEIVRDRCQLFIEQPTAAAITPTDTRS